MNSYLVKTMGTNGEWIAIAGFAQSMPVESMLRIACVAPGEKYQITSRSGQVLVSGTRARN